MGSQRQRLEPNNAWDCQKLEKAKKDPPLRATEIAWPCQHLDFEHLASKTVTEYISIV